LHQIVQCFEKAQLPAFVVVVVNSTCYCKQLVVAVKSLFITIITVTRSLQTEQCDPGGRDGPGEDNTDDCVPLSSCESASAIRAVSPCRATVHYRHLAARVQTMVSEYQLCCIPRWHQQSQ